MKMRDKSLSWKIYKGSALITALISLVLHSWVGWNQKLAQGIPAPTITEMQAYSQQVKSTSSIKDVPSSWLPKGHDWRKK